jgi:hypothetical protein
MSNKEGKGEYVKSRESREQAISYRFAVSSEKGAAYLLKLSDIEFKKLIFIVNNYQTHIRDARDILREGGARLHSRDGRHSFIIEDFERLFQNRTGENDKQAYIRRHNLQELSFSEFLSMLGIEDKESEKNVITLTVDIDQDTSESPSGGYVIDYHGLFRIKADQLSSVKDALSALGTVIERPTSLGGIQMKVIINEGRDKLELRIRDLPGIYADVNKSFVKFYGLDSKNELPGSKELLDLLKKEQLTKAGLSQRNIKNKTKPNEFLFYNRQIMWAENLRTSDMQLSPEMGSRYIHMTLSEAEGKYGVPKMKGEYAVPVSELKNIINDFYSLADNADRRSSREASVGMQYKVILDTGQVLRLRADGDVYTKPNKDKTGYEIIKPADFPDAGVLRAQLSLYRSSE